VPAASVMKKVRRVLFMESPILCVELTLSLNISGKLSCVSLFPSEIRA